MQNARFPSASIQQKIVVPFALIFAIATIAAALVSASFLTRTLESRLRQQLAHVSKMVSRSAFATNASILEKVKLIADAEVITFRRSGEILTSTLNAAESERLSRDMRLQDVLRRILDEGELLVVSDFEQAGKPYEVAYRPVQDDRDAVVAVIVGTGQIAATKHAIFVRIGLVAAALALLMLGVSYLVARSITVPLGGLVEVSARVSAGDLASRAVVDRDDEIGSLARAFNAMVERLEASQRELLRSEKLALTGQLAARVAHDVRNPLSSMKMRAQLLRKQFENDADGRGALEAILHEIDRVEWVVAGLLEIAKPTELRLVEGDVVVVLEEALRSMAAQLAHRKIEIERHFQEGIPITAIDSDRLRSAFLNLIANAADAMPEGGKLVASIALSRDRRAVEVSLVDTGIGLGDGPADRLFDPFFTTKRDGVGLGLMNARSVVEGHGGELSLVPGTSGGAVSIVSLPIVADTCRNGQVAVKPGVTRLGS